ncbi:MAG: hypothetical protein QOH13_2492, partial [Thermoleophilaceae bacterium]|nr:hypothetical protein [Thermoleophilaceae bacterium]
MSGLDAYRGQLVAAAARLQQQAAPMRTANRWRSRRGLLVIALAVLVAAPALAATQPWSPLLGSPEMHSQPKPTSAPPPREQVDTLGVLRREQTDADRGAVVQGALRYFGKSAVEIRTPYVRLLGSVAAGTAAVLVPAKHWDPAGDSGPSPAALDDPLCVFTPASNGDGGGKACFVLSQIANGQATGSLGRLYWGLVPDGVTSIRVVYADAKVVTVPVVDNYYALHQRGESRDISWIGADGAVLRTVGARAPSIGMPDRFRYHGGWITESEAARLKLACTETARNGKARVTCVDHRGG